MALKVAWKNPLPLIRTKPTLRKIGSDQFGAVHAVNAQDYTREFEVLPGEVA